MKRRIALAVVLTGLLVSNNRAATFLPTSGPQQWNANANWDTNSYPKVAGDSATLPAPTGDLTIDLGEPITIGSLTVNKAVTGDFDTTISGTATNTLTFDGGFTILNGFSSVGTGLTTVAAPVVFNSTLTVTQGDNDILDFAQPLSGTGGLAVNRNAGTYSTVVALSAANTYSGATTTFTGSTADDSLVIRLDPTSALPATTNVTLTQSAILELLGGNFTRAIGTGAGEIQFTGNGRNGWAAFGADREVNIGGAFATVTWGTGVGQANFGQLVLGNITSNATVDFRNPLDLGTSNRNIRSYEGSAAIDGKISGTISGGTGGGITKINDGVLSLAAANTYTGNTIVQGGILRLDHQDALGSGNLQIGSGGTLGIGADTTPGDPNSDFARTLGTAAGQIQLTNIGTGGNQTNAGFSAHGGNRSVVLSGGATLTWGSGSFLSGGTGTPNRHFILSGDSSDSTLDFKNPIDLAGANRTVVARNGSAVVDARLSGVISGNAASGLWKDNPGTLELSNANTYGGITRVNQGVLLLTNATAIPGGIAGGNTGNIEINSSNPNNTGVIGLGQGNFTTPLGTAAGQFQIVGSGGFAAFGADRVVNLGGGAQVTWATGGFASVNLALSATTADAAVDFQNPIDLNLATRVVQTRNGTSAIDGILSGIISGAGGGLDKQGGGTLVLTGANTYDGGTLVSEGRLLVNNTTGSGVGTGDVTVTAGTLGGSGFIGTGSDASNVTVSSGSRMAPGNSAGNLTVFGDVGLGSGSFMDTELGGLTAGTDFDKLSVNGIASLNGTLNVTLINSFTPAGGNSFEILSATGGVSGTFASVVLPTVSGITWQVQYNANSVVLNAQSAGLPGDFNSDGKVDAGDYVTWRKNDGTNNALANDNGLGTPVGTAHYDLWRANFGNPPGSGSSSGLGAVPEPTTVVLLCSIVPFVAWRKRGWIRA